MLIERRPFFHNQPADVFAARNALPRVTAEGIAGSFADQ